MTVEPKVPLQSNIPEFVNGKPSIRLPYYSNLSSTTRLASGPFLGTHPNYIIINRPSSIIKHGSNQTSSIIV